MEKGDVTVIFWVIIIVVMFMVFATFFSSFVASEPARASLEDFKTTVENVCMEGGQTSLPASLLLPKYDSKHSKLHLSTDGRVELYKCDNVGAGCSGGERVKTLQLDCPPYIQFENCWISPSTEQAYVTIIKDVKTVGLNTSSPEVYC